MKTRNDTLIKFIVDQKQSLRLLEKDFRSKADSLVVLTSRCHHLNFSGLLTTNQFSQIIKLMFHWLQLRV